MVEVLNSARDSFLLALPKFTARMVALIALFLIARPFLNGAVRAAKLAMEKNKVDPLLETFTISLIKTLIYVMYLFILISIIGIEATSLLTVLGTAGIAVGLALQGSLSNLAGGVLILFFRPFTKGDFISNGGGIEGIVDETHILYTVLNTTDNKMVMVPNGQLANNPIINFSRNKERRVDLIFSVSYDTPIEKVETILKQVAASHPDIMQDKDPIIRLMKHNASSLDFAFRVWVKTENYWKVYFDCTEKVKDVFDKNSIEIPYQKIDLYNRG